MGDLHCQSSASDTYAPKAHLQAEMTIDGIVEGISAKFMINSAKIMINSARFMTISASSAFILRFLEHTPPPATHRARVMEETFTKADKYFVQTSAVLLCEALHLRRLL